MVRALCNNRLLPVGPGLEVVQGSIGDHAVVERAMARVTHVVHLATVKETPDCPLCPGAPTRPSHAP